MRDTSHLKTLLRSNKYDREAKNKLMEVGSITDLEWLYQILPYDKEDVKRILIQKGNINSLKTILRSNKYDREAKNKLMEVGSIADLEWLYQILPYDKEDIRKAIISYEPPKENINQQVSIILPKKIIKKELLNKLREVKLKNKLKTELKKRRLMKEISYKTVIKNFDVFICHASEDKKDYVNLLAKSIKEAGIKIWYDDFVLEWGDSLRDSIDRGLVNSKYGIVVFSKAFLDNKKRWTKYELDGIFAKEINGKKAILPIWHNISRDELLTYSPSFADRIAKNTNSDSIENIVESVKKLLKF